MRIINPDKPMSPGGLNMQVNDRNPIFERHRIDTARKTRDHIRQLQALGFTVTLEPAA
jgi:hypothetical protein